MPLVLFFIALFWVVANGQGYPVFQCPAGWSLLPWDDTCSAVWPRAQINGDAYDGVNAALLSRPMNFNRAREMCAEQDASLPTIRDLATQLEFYKDLVGRTSGRSFWINVWADPADKDFATNPGGTPWITTDRRDVGFVFDWDLKRSMPRPFDRCVAMHMKGDGIAVHGGNEKMIGTDCGSVHHVVCTKKRVPAGIAAINEGEPRRMEFVWNTSDLQLTFYGTRIPEGTLLTLQSANGVDSQILNRQPTRCQGIRSISGVSAPFRLSVTASVPSIDADFSDRFCGAGSTTCDTATVTIPRDWPFVRGAKYSLCFFVADIFDTPSSSLLEFENELLGDEMVIDVVQKYSSYQEDICDMRAKDITTFYGGYSDTAQPKLTQTPFDSAVEESKDTLLSFETLNPPKGYEFLN